MAFVKLAFQKRKRVVGESPELFFSHVEGPFSFLAGGMPQEGFPSAKGVGDFKMNSNRYSYLGYDPFLICSSRMGVTRLRKRRDFFEWKKSSVEQIFDSEPLEVLGSVFKKVAYKDKAPVPFFGGAFGFFSYDFGVGLEGVKQTVVDDLETPDFVFGFYDKIVAFDHATDEIYFLGLGETDLQARKKMQEIQADLEKPVLLTSDGEFGPLQTNLTSSQYEAKISKIQELLRDGETYQVNFSQRFSADCTMDPWKIFKKLSAENPAPFSCYFDAGDFQILSASPELLVRKRGAMVETWPIKGTVAREMKNDLEPIKNYKLQIRNDGVAKPPFLDSRFQIPDSFEDQPQIEKLLASKKDEAELSMIVDLERNDLGKVCVPGSVKVESHREIQVLANVIHTFSRVTGKLGSKYNIFDLIKAVFPGGSITGCPKRRTMEIIDQLEDFKRGVYTGSAGFINFAGDADFNILIRTMIRKGSRVYFQSGGGIVIDSNAQSEYEEMLAKANGMQVVFPIHI